MISISSRYYRGTVAHANDAASGNVYPAVYRKLPSPRRQKYTYYTLTPNDRLDNLAQRFYGDPKLFWRILDYNNDILSLDQLLDSSMGAATVIRIPFD